MTPFGLFEFLGMPPGLCNATQTFQRNMDNLLRELDFVGCFIHDLIVYSKSHEEHIQHLNAIFDILRAQKLTINPEKCEFGKDEVTHLGCNVNYLGYQPPAYRVQAIASYPKPGTISDQHRFLGFINYYRISTCF